MVFNFEFLGIGSKRRWALRVFDKTLGELQVNPAYVDDGMRYLIYNWAAELEALRGGEKGVIDAIMRDAATLVSLCILGPAETKEMWGEAVSDARQARFDAAIAKNDDEDFDTRLIKLVLTKGNAAADIRAVVELD
ncbi:MAG: hypothetical protein RLN70_03230 [Rhodospirillaceae bacterium]